jgi:hypothetical protein
MIEFIKLLGGRKLIVIFLSILVLGVVLYPIIYENFLYFNLLNQRISILERVSELNFEEIDDNEILFNEYNSIIKKIGDYDEENDLSYKSIFHERTSKELKFCKIFFGSIIFILLFLRMCAKKNIKGIIQFIVLALIGGYVGYLLPSFRCHYINYFGIVGIELILLITYNDYRKNQKSQ